MPTKLQSPCRGGCGELLNGGGFCPDCKSKHHRQDRVRRGTRHDQGYDNRWQKARDLYVKAHPLCEICEAEGKVAQTAVVDHIVPVRDGQNDPLFWRQQNWQSLCTRHDRRKQKLDSEIRRRYDSGMTLEQVIDYTRESMIAT